MYPPTGIIHLPNSEKATEGGIFMESTTKAKTGWKLLSKEDRILLLAYLAILQAQEEQEKADKKQKALA